MSIPDVAIYGSSGHSRAANAVLSKGISGHPHCRVVAYIDDFSGADGKLIDGLPVLTFEKWHLLQPRPFVFIAIGNTTSRRQLYDKVIEAGGEVADLYADPILHINGVEIGLGTIICTPGHVGYDTRIGDNVQIMPMCSIGHNLIIGSHCTICPSVTISGHVVVEDGVFLGAGSTIINGKADKPLVIGAGATVAAGSVVTKSVPPKSTVMGNPARSLKDIARERRSRE